MRKYRALGETVGAVLLSIMVTIAAAHAFLDTSTQKESIDDFMAEGHVVYKNCKKRRLRYGFWGPAGQSRQTAEGQAAKQRRRPTILILQGRASFIEKHEMLIRDLRAREFPVATFDFTGQGASIRLISHPQKGHIDTYATYIDDVACAIHETQKIAPGPIVLYGASMGGHVLLRYLLSKTPDTLPRSLVGAVLVSPMIDIQTPPFPRWSASLIINILDALGFEKAYAPGQGDYNPDKRDAPGPRGTTSDVARYRYQKNVARILPKHVVGGPTVGWIKATFDSITTLLKAAPAQHNLPILFINAGQDYLLDTQYDAYVAQKLSGTNLVTYPEARHNITAEREEIRAQFFSDLDNFTRRIYMTEVTGAVRGKSG